MLRSTSKLTGTAIAAKDGEIGAIEDFYFDDIFWAIRYFVAHTGNWLPGQKVLLAPEVFEAPNEFADNIPVALTMDEIRNSPPYNETRPVSRQYEAKLHEYFRWMPYWLMRDPHFTPVGAIPQAEQEVSLNRLARLKSRQRDNELSLRSTEEVTGYHIEAINGDIGHVEDFLVDDDNWRIRYMVVDTRNWLPGGKKVLIAPHWIEDVAWESSRVKVELSREVIENSPGFDYEKIYRSESLVD